ncbi:MAG TPA: PAS domain-containing protein, partial [Rubrobacter sp.]|nr:PAS domain-containing protein [Rubrobacter sp.]
NSIVITDPNLPDDPLVYVNPAFEETTGFAAREALGRNCRFLQGEDRNQPALAELGSAVREGRQCTVVLRNYRKDGTLFWNELSIYPVRDEEGRLTNFLGVQNDVTERVRTEEILAEIRRAERRRIARDLHDIVLQDLSGALQSLRLTDLQAKGSGPDLGEELEALARATSGLRSAIYDLRHEGEQPLVKSIESLVGLNQQQMPGREVVLSVEEGLPEGLPRRMSVELLRVVQEALANARRHSGAEHIEVRLRAEGDGNTVVAEVEDDGRGFDRRTVRAGVGLSAMHERAAGLGGEIEIEGRPGCGTKVTLRVPVGGGNLAPPRR